MADTGRAGRPMGRDYKCDLMSRPQTSMLDMLSCSGCTDRSVFRFVYSANSLRLGRSGATKLYWCRFFIVFNIARNSVNETGSPDVTLSFPIINSSIEYWDL